MSSVNARCNRFAFLPGAILCGLFVYGTTVGQDSDLRIERVALQHHYNAKVHKLAAWSRLSLQDEVPQKKAVNWRARRILLHREFGAKLQELAMWCRDNDLSKKQASETFKVYREFSLDRQYIYLPTTRTMPTADPARVGEIPAMWLQKLNQIKIDHAAKLFDLGKEAAKADSYAVAFQLLHEVIYYDRDHAEVRRILGHTPKDGEWRIHSEKVNPPVVAKKNHDVVPGWPAGTYRTINTRHFRIDSNAPIKDTLHLAKQLESWHYVWRQVFFEFWAKAPLIKKWLGGKGSLNLPKRRFRVAFFKSFDNYVKQLTPIQPMIARSVGYYDGDRKMSFFPATNVDGVRDEAYWRHELTHQLFRESIRSRSMPFEEHFLWLDEGLAMYFESLKMEGQLGVLGGFDSQRLQYARWRKLRENYHVPIGQLAAMDKQTFQKRTDIAFLYAEAAGIAHMMMDSRKYDLQPVLVRFMKLIHQRKVQPSAFQKMIGRSYADLDNDYAEFLAVTSRDVERRVEHIGTISELAAMDGELRESAFDVIGTCLNLRKLDISNADFTKSRAQKLQQLDLLGDLYLNASVIEPGALKRLDQLDSLRELDLSRSSLNDSLASELTKLPSLESLYIANTAISDTGLITIAKIPKLKVVDITGVKVSAAGIARFKSLRGDVRLLQRQ